MTSSRQLYRRTRIISQHRGTFERTVQVDSPLRIIYDGVSINCSTLINCMVVDGEFKNCVSVCASLNSREDV